MAKPDLSSITSILSGIFSSSNTTIGVDIGISSVKVCEMSKGVGGSYTLLSFASEVLSEAAIIEDEIQKGGEISDIIKDLIKKISSRSKNACIGLEGPRTMTKRFEIPDGSKEEVEDNILWEAEQYITFGSDHAEISHHEITKTDNGNVDVLIAAANIDVAKNFMAVVENAGLKVKTVDLDVLALANIFEILYKSEKTIIVKPNLIIDFGAQATKMVLFQGEAPLLTKEVNIGSVLATEEVQRSMGVSYFEAEDLKLGIDEQGSIPEEVKDSIWRVNERIIDEVKKTINFFHSTSGGERINKIFVTGGGCMVDGLVDGIETETEIETAFLEPFDKVKVGKKVPKDYVELIARTGCVAMGLAMR